jgi:hypothetical protein
MNRSGDGLLDGRQKFDSRQRRSFVVLHNTCVSHPASHAVRIRVSCTYNSPSSSAEIHNIPSSTSTFPHITLTWYLSFEKIVVNLRQMEDECLASDNSVQQCLVAYGPWTLRGSRVLQKVPRIYIISQHDMLL